MYCMSSSSYFFFFFNDTATTEIYTLSLHDALPISSSRERSWNVLCRPADECYPDRGELRLGGIRNLPVVRCLSSSMNPRIFISCVSREFGSTRNRLAAILVRLGYEPVWQDVF